MLKKWLLDDEGLKKFRVGAGFLFYTNYSCSYASMNTNDFNCFVRIKLL